MGRFFRWLGIFFGIIFVIPMGLILWSVMHTPTTPKASILRVVIDGPLAEAARPSITGLVRGRMHNTLYNLTEGIRHAATDDRIVGMVLDIRTPALGLAQLAELQAAISIFQNSNKWNLAYLETAGEVGHGDGAYALACTAKQIALSPPGEINLEGLRSEVPFLKDALAHLHINSFTEQRYEYKNFANTFTQNDFTPAHRESLTALLDDMQQTLLETIATGRAVNEQTARHWVEQAPWAASDALKQHLVDRLAYWDEVQAEAEKVAGRDEPFVDAEDYVARRTPLTSSGPELALIVGSGQISLGEGGKHPLEATDEIGSTTLAEAFRDARRDKVRGVLFRIDSPGGSYVASDLIRREVELTRKAGIPVVVSMGNVAASGGYFASIDADHIVAEPGTITGSIGVFAQTFALREFLQHWLSVHFGVYESIPHAGSLSWLDVPSDADRAVLAKTLDRIYGDFVTKVATARHKTYEQIHEVAKGRVWTGRQALAHGLVDELGGVDTALGYLRQRLGLTKNADVRLVTYPEPASPLDMLRDIITSQAAMQTSLGWLRQAWTALMAPQSMTLLAPWMAVPSAAP